MRPELFRIPLPDWSWLPVDGLPIRGYGAMLALGFLAAILVAAWRARREGENPDHIYNAAILALLGGVFGARLFDVIEYSELRYPNWTRGLNVFEGVDVFWLIVGAVAGAGLALADVLPWSRKSRPRGPRRWWAVAVWAVVGGIIAGRGAFIRAHAEQYTGFIEALKITSGGLTAYGGLILALILVMAYFIYLQCRHGVNALAMADITAPSLALGLAFGRMGCFLNGCCYGAPSHLPWAFAWPEGSIPYEAGLEGPIHPAQLYGVLNGLLLFLVLHLGFRFKPRHGAVIGAFFGLYAVSRFLLEGVRVDEPKVYLGGLSISQSVSAFALAAVVLYFLWLRSAKLASLSWRPPEQRPKNQGHNRNKK